jgi:uncharacterized cupredoxin-like copper-binding protein
VHRRLTSVLALLCLCAAAAPASSLAHRAVSPVILVTVGKPHELSFTLSKKTVPAGTVTFQVTNKGKLAHAFKVCTKASANAKANSCTGVATKSLAPGAKALLTVKLSAKGSYEYLSSTAGQAASGMKGLLTVTAKSTTPSVNPTPGPGPATTTTPAATGAQCTSPQSSTITVQEGDTAFTISAQTFHCGSVTFNLQNTGTFQHNFDILGLANGAGVTPTLNPGASATVTITVPPGKYTAQSDIGDQAAQGLQTALVVNSG